MSFLSRCSYLELSNVVIYWYFNHLQPTGHVMHQQV
jgi:hypothetical protein